MKKINKIKNDTQSLQMAVTSRLISGLYKKLEDYVIEGLKRKGFEFENKSELEDFFRKRVTRTDNTEFKEHIYYVDSTPFFLHKYEMIYEPITEDNNGIKMSANYGSYAYL